MALLGPLPPSQFIGRNRIVAQVEERLHNPEFLSSSITGGPQIGKTSFLRYLARRPVVQLSDGKNRLVFVTYDAAMLGGASDPYHFWTGTLREIRAHPEMEPLQAILDEAITRSQGQLLDEYDLQDFFDASARHNLRIALLVDNFDYALRNDRFWIRNDFFHHLRTLGQRVPRAVAFVVATPRSLLEYNRPGIVSSPFHNIFWNFPLGLLSERDLEAYVRQYLDNRHLQDASGTIPAVVAEASGGHPFVANFVLSLCADALEAGRDVDPDDIARQLENPDGPIVTLSHQIREILTPVERLYLNKALNGETLSPAERERLRQLASNGLLPPGVSP